MATTNKTGIQATIVAEIKSGNSDTTALGLRAVLYEVLDSYVNVKDGGLFYEAETGYNTLLTLTDPKSFVYKQWVEDYVSAASGLTAVLAIDNKVGAYKIVGGTSDYSVLDLSASNSNDIRLELQIPAYGAYAAGIRIQDYSTIITAVGTGGGLAQLRLANDTLFFAEGSMQIESPIIDIQDHYKKFATFSDSYSFIRNGNKATPISIVLAGTDNTGAPFATFQYLVSGDQTSIFIVGETVTIASAVINNGSHVLSGVYYDSGLDITYLTSLTFAVDWAGIGIVTSTHTTTETRGQVYVSDGEVYTINQYGGVFVTDAIPTRLNFLQVSSFSNRLVHSLENTFSAPVHSFDNSVKKNGLEVATENYVDNLITGLSWKKSVLYSTNTGENLSLTGLTETIDGASRTLLATDRILVKNQTTASQNGIYNPNAGAWTRVTDADSADELEAATVYVREGAGEKNRVYAVNVAPITLGVTSITFALISGAGAYTYGAYLKLTGNVFDIDFTTFSTTQISEGTNKYLSNSNLATVNHAATVKATIVDADEVNGLDSAGGFSLFRTTWANIMVYIKSKLFAKVNGGNTNYSISDADKVIYIGTAFTAPRTYTLPTAASVNGSKTIGDFIGTITSANTLTIGVQVGEYLNGVLNGTEVIQSAYGQRVLYPDGINGWNFDAGIVRQTKTQTITNKTIQKRILVVTQSATPATNIDNGDIVKITGIAQAITSMTSGLSGTPYDGQMILWQLTDNGTARAITWGASFASTTNFTLPTTTVISTMLRVLTQWNAVTSKHECIG